MQVKLYILIIVSLFFSISQAQFIEKSEFWGGSGNDNFIFSNLADSNCYILGHSNSLSFTGTNNFTGNSNSNNIIAKFNSNGDNTHTFIYETTNTYNGYSFYFSDFKVYKDTAYILYPIEQTSYNQIIYKKLNLNNGNTIFADTFEYNTSFYPSSLLIDSNAQNVYLLFKSGNTQASYQATDTLLSTNPTSSLYIHYNGRTNQILYSSYLSNYINSPILINNKLYFNTHNPTNANTSYNFCLDALQDTLINSFTSVSNNLTVFSYTLSNYYQYFNEQLYIPQYYNNFFQIIIYDSIFNPIDSFTIGASPSNNYRFFFYGDYIYTLKDDNSNTQLQAFYQGNLVIDTNYTNMQNAMLLKKDGFLHLVGYSQNLTTTDGTLGSSNSNALFYAKIDTGTYHICKSTYVGATKTNIGYNTNNNNSNNLFISQAWFYQNKIHIVGNSNLANMPKTGGQFLGNNDIFYTIFNPETSLTLSTVDTLFPITQTVCKNGLAELIIGQKMEFTTTDSLPLVYLGNESYQQTIANKCYYQWQEANNINGPYTDIAGAINKNYLPEVNEENKYYRRITTYTDCNGVYKFISDTASVLVNTHFSPIVDIGEVYHTCPNVNVNIGTIPTATGGTLPYTYSWSNNTYLPTTITNTANNELLTLLVTDANGCTQYDQASILVHQAEIKTKDVAACNQDSAILIANTIQGLTGVTYQWTGNNMCCPNSVINHVAPISSQNYILTQTIPITGGNTCSTSDTISVERIIPPANFAGPDRLECLGAEVRVGIAPVSGFNYHWLPNSAVFLSADSSQPVLRRYNNTPSANVNYFANQMPSPNPLPVIGIIQQKNCVFYDTAYIAYMEAVNKDYRKAYCDETLIGSPDRTPNINETYSWTQISGNTQILGATNQAQLAIDNTTNTGTSVFQLTTTATVNGITNQCTNNVNVYRNYTKQTGQSSCLPITYKGNVYTNDTVIWETIPSTTAFCDTIHRHEIIITSCVKFCQFENNGIRTITAAYSLPPNNNYVFNWSVTQGPTNNVVFSDSKVLVYDDIYREITLNITSPTDTSIQLQYVLNVNGGSWNPIAFTALDTTLCHPANSIHIGENVSGYNFLWEFNGNQISTASNPFVMPPNIGINNYSVKVSRNGCHLNDYATINVLKLEDDFAGIDLEVCDNAYIKLGNSSNPSNYQYRWEPNNAFWQNGTDSSSANPEVLSSVTTNFIVYVADQDSLCFASDTVTVTVNNTPTLDIPDFNICKNEDTIIGIPNYSGATFTWSPAIGLSCTNCVTPTVNLSNSQTYTVDILFDGNCVNPNYTDIVNVNIVEVNSNMQDITYCPDGNTVNIGSDAPAGMSNYTWTPNNKVNNPYIRNTFVNSPNGSTNENFYLSFTDNNQCQVFDTLTIAPSVNLPAVNAGFSHSICLGESTTLGQFNFSDSATYSWSPTANLSSLNTSYTTFTPADTGTYTFVLTKVENNTNCITTDTVTVFVSNVFADDLNYQICQNTCETIGFSNTNYSYLWFPTNNLSNNNIATPEVCNLSSSQTYNVQISNQYGCIQNTDVVVDVYNYTPPTITINDTMVFPNNSFSLDVDINPQNNYIYNWGNSPYILNGNTKNGLFNFYQTGIYNLTLEVIDPNSGCTSSENVTITVVDLINIYNEISVCDSFVYNGQSYFTNQNFIDSITFDTIVFYQYIVNYSKETNETIYFCDSIEINSIWYFSDTTIKDTLQTINACDSIIYFHYKKGINSLPFSIDTIFCNNENFNMPFGNDIISQEGNYSNTFINATGCDSIVNLKVTKLKAPDVVSIFDTTNCLGESITLNAAQLFGDTFNYQWDFTNENTIELKENTNFNLLVMNTSNNCKQEINFIVNFKDCISSCSVLIPTGFSPNNDGINDKLAIFHNCKYGITDFKINIYNRWGELIFVSKNINQNWDGTYKNKPAAIGVYSYSVEYLKNGDSKINHQSGNITLIR